jgi:hypothetical protein
VKYSLAAALAGALLLAACATPQTVPEPAVRTVTVKVATPVTCPALTALGPEPTYPDTDEALNAATSIGQLAALYSKGRLARVQRLAEYVTARASCIF